MGFHFGGAFCLTMRLSVSYTDLPLDQVFKAFCPSKRLHVKYADLPLDLLHVLLSDKDQFLQSKKKGARASVQGQPVKRRRSSHDKSAW